MMHKQTIMHLYSIDEINVKFRPSKLTQSKKCSILKMKVYYIPNKWILEPNTENMFEIIFTRALNSNQNQCNH